MLLCLERDQKTTTMIGDKLTEKIIGAAFKVHNALGFGFREKVYQRALLYELKKMGLNAVEEFHLNIYYDGKIISKHRADIYVEEKILLELKTLLTLSKGDEVQLVNYLTATNVEIGLLINFGQSVQIKRKYKTYKGTG